MIRFSHILLNHRTFIICSLSLIVNCLSSNQNRNYLLILKLALCFYMLHIIRTTILSKKDKWDMLSLRRVGWVVQKQSWVKKSWTNISIPSFMLLNLTLKRNHLKKPFSTLVFALGSKLDFRQGRDQTATSIVSDSWYFQTF